MFLKYAGFAGIIGSILSIVSVLMATILCGAGCGDVVDSQFVASWGPDGSFSWEINALSDLGVSKVANFFNYPLILAGILNFVFGVGFMKAYARTKISRVPIILWIIGGVSLSMVGIFTETYGVLHTIVSAGFFILMPVSMILIGITFLISRRNTKGYLSILAGVIALTTISSYITGLYNTSGVGFSVPEFITAIILSSWIIWMGISLLNFKSQQRKL